ncbi:TetR/AcrR family transcriptional regulator [candidate division WOR-3 bacterium]|nr:TetR/AcrR family transcriptional regulator [candidate division WOR-3 bacterium]
MNKKEKIMNAAINFFSENGFDKSALDDIAKYAGVGKGTLYLYFKDKEDIYIKSIKNIFDKWIEKMDEVIKLDLNASEKLEKYLDVNIKQIISNMSLAKILMREIPNFLLKLHKSNKMGPMKIYKKREKHLCMIIEQGINSGEFKNVNKEIMANIIIGSVNSYVMKYIFHSEKICEKDFKKYKKIILCLVKKEVK